jgi:alpha-tubulin suppressor-like RCC1 family protein
VLRTDGTITCWGYDGSGQVSGVPTGTFTAVTAGHYYSCGLRIDGNITCWGDGSYGRVPTGTFTAVTAGYDHSCGLRTDGTHTCWGHRFFDSTVMQ